MTVRSLGSALRTFSYSVIAFGNLPCWTNFSAALRAFCLLKPKPNAIKVRTPAPVRVSRSSAFALGREFVAKLTIPAALRPVSGDGLQDKGNCTAGYSESYGY